jgi:hypothetical protein
MQPEQEARETIDRMLGLAGWTIQDSKEVNIHAKFGVAIRNFPLKSGHGFADYILYVNQKAAGVIEAKKVGSTLTGVEIQSGKYKHGLPAALPAWHRPPKDQEAERTRIQKGDLLITIVGTAGITALVRQGIGKAYVSQGIGLVRPLPLMNPQYLEYYLTCPDWGAKFLKEKQYGMGRGHLLLSEIRETPIAVPPYAEQCAIVEALVDRLS